MKKLSAFLLIAMLLLAIFACDTSVAIPNPPLILGEKYLTDLDYEQALLQFDQAISIEPKNPRGYLGKADALLHLEQKDEAATALSDGARATRGKIRTALQEAQAKAEESIVDGYIGLSAAYDKLGWRDIALVLLKRVCEKLPEEKKLKEALEKLRGTSESTQSTLSSVNESTTPEYRNYPWREGDEIQEYDAEGRPLKIKYDMGDSDEIRLLTWREDGTLAQVKSMYYEKSGALINYNIMVYDAKGLGTREDLYDADDTLWGYNIYQDNSRLEYKPDGTPR